MEQFPFSSYMNGIAQPKDGRSDIREYTLQRVIIELVDGYPYRVYGIDIFSNWQITGC